MKERTEPDFIQFRPGDVVEGVLVSVQRIMVQGKPAVRYTVDGGGKLYAFLGTYQLNTKLRPSDVGHWVAVRYEGEDTNVKRGENSMRIFTVAVSDELATPEFAAQSDDIPF